MLGIMAGMDQKDSCSVLWPRSSSSTTAVACLLAGFLGLMYLALCSHVRFLGLGIMVGMDQNDSYVACQCPCSSTACSDGGFFWTFPLVRRRPGAAVDDSQL